MNNRLLTKTITALASLTILFAGCKDFIEPSIDKRQITLQAPADGYLSTKYTMNFWWDEVDDALSYRLQIVTPNFTAPGALVTDTLVHGHTFAINVDPGEYEWRIRAENGSSATAYSSPRTFTVAQSSIKPQSVQLKSPANNTLTSAQTISFQWGGLYGATKYRLEIDTNNFANENNLVSDQSLPGLQFNFSLNKDMIYQWRVRAENDTAQSRWSAINQLTIDRTPPGKVSLVAPINGQTVNRPALLQWQAVPGAAKYKVYVLKSDSSSNYNQNFPVIINSTAYTFSVGLSGEKLYWKISAIDAAGNEGDAGPARNFLLQ